MAKSDSSGAQTPSGEGESTSWLGVTSPGARAHRAEARRAPEEGAGSAKAKRVASRRRRSPANALPGRSQGLDAERWPATNGEVGDPCGSLKMSEICVGEGQTTDSTRRERSVSERKKTREWWREGLTSRLVKII